MSVREGGIVGSDGKTYFWDDKTNDCVVLAETHVALSSVPEDVVVNLIKRGNCVQQPVAPIPNRIPLGRPTLRS